MWVSLSVLRVKPRWQDAFEGNQSFPRRFGRWRFNLFCAFSPSVLYVWISKAKSVSCSGQEPWKIQISSLRMCLQMHGSLNENCVMYYGYLLASSFHCSCSSSKILSIFMAPFVPQVFWAFLVTLYSFLYKLLHVSYIDLQVPLSVSLDMVCFLMSTLSTTLSCSPTLPNSSYLICSYIFLSFFLFLFVSWSTYEEKQCDITHISI